VPVVKGDRIGESQKLNRCSIEAHVAYAAFVAVVPDDFGRFRATVFSIVERMFPRREDRRQLERKVALWLKEWEAHDLLRTWTCDGVTFGEVTNWKPTGNAYHRSPEPPWSTHEHRGFCLRSAISRSRDWSDPQETENLVLRLNELRRRKPDGGPTSDRSRAQDSPSPPSPPSPSRQRNPPSPPPAGGNGRGNGHGPKALARVEVDRRADRYGAWWVAIGGHPMRENYRRLKETIRAGLTDGQIMEGIANLVHEEMQRAGKTIPDPWPPNIPLAPDS